MRKETATTFWKLASGKGKRTRLIRTAGSSEARAGGGGELLQWSEGDMQGIGSNYISGAATLSRASLQRARQRLWILTLDTVEGRRVVVTWGWGC